MKKNPIIVTLFVLPLLFLCGLIIYRVANSWTGSTERTPDDQLATATNPNYRKLQEDWLKSQFDPLFGVEDILAKIKDLPIRYIDPVQSEVDNAELYGALSRVIQSLLAKTFDEYVSLRSVGESLTLQEDFIAWQGQVVRRFHKVHQIPTDPLELHKVYWSKTTEDGKRATLWEAASWQASWVECRKTTKLDPFASTEAFSESLRPSVPNCGIVGYASSFQYGPSPKNVLSKDGHIVMALAYVLVKTSEGKAYPLMIQFYWASSIRTWLPTHLAVGYVGNRQFDPVF